MPDIINLKKLNKDLTRISGTLTTIETTATVRTLNIVLDRSVTILARDVNEDTGINIGTVKRRMTKIKATRFNFRAAIHMKDQRVPYPKVNKISGGVSFQAGKKRKKVTSPQNGGSRPFKAGLPAGGIPGNKVSLRAAVYVRPDYVHKKGRKKKPTDIHPRRLAVMYGSSIPHVARKDWQEKVEKFSYSEFRKEYPNQLKKAKFTGRF